MVATSQWQPEAPGQVAMTSYQEVLDSDTREVPGVLRMRSMPWPCCGSRGKLHVTPRKYRLDMGTSRSDSVSH